jgi:hypothetical protein
MIRMSRNVSILSVMLMMTVTVMATVTVAFATPKEGDNGQAKVEVCHKGKIITVAEPAVAAHERHDDDPELCENGETPPEPPEGTTPELTTTATTSVTLGASISDTATLSGATSDATGTIALKLYAVRSPAATRARISAPPTISSSRRFPLLGLPLMFRSVAPTWKATT